MAEIDATGIRRYERRPSVEAMTGDSCEKLQAPDAHL